MKPSDPMRVSWDDPHDEMTKLAFECMEWIRTNETLANALEGSTYAFIIDNDGQVGTMASVHSDEGRPALGRALATILALHMRCIRKFIQETPQLKEEMLRMLREMATT